MMHSAQRVATLKNRLVSLESRRSSESYTPEGVDDSAVNGAMHLLSTQALDLMQKKALEAIPEAQGEYIRCERELVEKRRAAEQVREVLRQLQVQVDNMVQRREQQEADDLYAARKSSRHANQS
jgi:hypothetical protein